MFQDVHLHLQDVPSHVAHQILEAARFHVVERLFCNATSPSNWNNVATIARRYRGVVPFFGLHPWYLSEVEENAEKALEQFLIAHPDGGVGEIGLDRGRHAGDYARQKSIFAYEINLAVALKRPFNLHCVYAWNDILEVLRKKQQEAPLVPFIAHGFNESPAMAEEILALGGFISVSQRLLEGKHRDVLTMIPTERLLIETDFPYHRRNDQEEPLTAEEYFFVLESVYRQTAAVKKIEVEVLAKAVWKNGDRLLGNRE
jgi:TatD DNase family protein